ncbi:MAG TPA: ATP-binding protein [Cyclobacteriaceae bacterium]|nr:ATP-binding protein [Cyclobacteriaceae bacterium]
MTRNFLRKQFSRKNSSFHQLKNLLDDKVEKLEVLSAELRQKNVQLKKQYDELCAQSDRIDLQYQLIELMNAELNSHSKKLEEKVNERTKELEHSNRLLKRYNENLEQYTFAISHQLKAPIARVLGLTQLMRIVPELERISINENLHSEAKELDGIFKQLVHALNLKHDSTAIKVENLNIESLLHETWEMLRRQSDAEARLECKVIGDASLDTDKNHLTEAVAHILANALKFHKPQCGARVKAEIVRGKEWMKIRIKDNGIGFDTEDVAEKLFTPFSKFNVTHSGRGMGLYLTKQHVSILGGDVWVASRLNKGTETIIELPLN